MQPHGIVQPHNKRPSFFWIPAPVASPRIGCPQSTQYGGNGEKQKTHRNGFVHHFFDGGGFRQPCGLRAFDFPQFGHAEHGSHTKRAVADKVGGHMDFHPPRLQRRNQRLDLMRIAGKAVPQHKAHQHRHKEIHKRAQPLHMEAAFVIQVHQAGNHHKQDEYFIQIGYRNMPRIRAQQIAFVPAHQQTDKAHYRRRPCQTGADVQESIVALVLAPSAQRACHIAK